MSINQEIAASILAAIGVLGLLTAIAVYLMIAMAWQEFTRAAPERNLESIHRSPSALIRLAVARRCPRCGRGTISRAFFQMNSQCPECAVHFDTGAGEWIGPAVINYSAALAAALAGWAIAVLLNLGEVLQVVTSAAIAIGAGILIVPWSRSFWTLFLYLNGELRVDSRSSKPG